MFSLGYETDNYYSPELYDIKGEISSKRFLDLLQSQIYLEIGSEDFANSIIKKQMGDVDVDVKDNVQLTEKLRDLVERIKKVEFTLLPTETAEALHRKRMGLLSRVKD